MTNKETTFETYDMTLRMSRGGKKLSVYFGQELSKLQRAQGISHYVMKAVKSSTIVVSLCPIFLQEGEKIEGALMLQRKEGGQTHMELPMDKLGATQVGLYDNKVSTTARVYLLTATLQILRPTPAAVAEAAAKVKAKAAKTKR